MSTEAASGRSTAARVTRLSLKDDLWPELEKLGEARVRELLDLQIYRGGTRFYVEEWLRYKEFPQARKALGRKQRPPANSLNRMALVAAGTIAVTAFVAHWTLLG